MHMVRLKPSLGSYIIELHEKARSLEAEIRKEAGKTGRHYRHLDGIELGSGSHAIEAMEQNRRLKTKLGDVFENLGRAYYLKGDADSSKYYFARAKAVC